MNTKSKMQLNKLDKQFRKDVSVLLCFPALISTERQVQRRNYKVKTRQIRVVYSDKLKQAYITANVNYEGLTKEAMLMRMSTRMLNRPTLKALFNAKDLKVLDLQKVRIGTVLNNAKAQWTLTYTEKGYTVLNNVPRPTKKKLFEALAHI